MNVKNKVTEYKDILGKKIIKIEDDDFSLRLHFDDGTFATIESREYLTLDTFQQSTEKLIAPKIYCEQ